MTDRVINPGVSGLPMAQDAFLESTLFTDAGIWLAGLLITIVLGVVIWLAVRLAPDGDVPEPGSEAPIEPAVTAGAVSRRRSAPPVRGRAGLAGAEPGRRLPEGARAAPDRRDALLAAGTGGLGARLPSVAPGPAALAALRRGLPRAIGGRVPERLGERLGPRRLRVDPSDAGEVPHRRRNRGWPTRTRSSAPPTSGRPRRLAVAPRRASSHFDRSIVFTADGGETIVARDAETARRSRAGRRRAGRGPRLRRSEGHGSSSDADRGEVETFELGPSRLRRRRAPPRARRSSPASSRSPRSSSRRDAT